MSSPVSNDASGLGWTGRSPRYVQGAVLVTSAKWTPVDRRPRRGRSSVIAGCRRSAVTKCASAARTNRACEVCSPARRRFSIRCTDLGVEAEAGVEGEVAVVGQAERRSGGVRPARSASRIAPVASNGSRRQPDGPDEDVGRAAGHHGQRRQVRAGPSVEQPVDHLVDGAVAAERDDDVEPRRAAARTASAAACPRWLVSATSTFISLAERALEHLPAAGRRGGGRGVDHQQGAHAVTVVRRVGWPAWRRRRPARAPRAACSPRRRWWRSRAPRCWCWPWSTWCSPRSTTPAACRSRWPARCCWRSSVRRCCCSPGRCARSGRRPARRWSRSSWSRCRSAGRWPAPTAGPRSACRCSCSRSPCWCLLFATAEARDALAREPVSEAATRPGSAARAAGPGCGPAAGTRASARCRARPAICDWVRLPKNRSRRIRRSRAGSESSSGLSDSRYSTPSSDTSSAPSVSATDSAVASPSLAVERDGRVGVGRLQALEHLLLADLQVLGELGDRRGAAQRLGEVGGGRGQRRRAAPAAGAAPGPSSPCPGSAA